MLQGGVLETLVQCYGTSGDCNTHIQTHTHKIIQACDFDLQIFFCFGRILRLLQVFGKVLLCTV